MVFETLPPRSGNFPFEGPFGTFDRAALQRGFQVYKDVCSACHSLEYIAFRNGDFWRRLSFGPAVVRV